MQSRAGSPAEPQKEEDGNLAAPVPLDPRVPNRTRLTGKTEALLIKPGIRVAVAAEATAMMSQS